MIGERKRHMMGEEKETDGGRWEGRQMKGEERETDERREEERQVKGDWKRGR